MKDTIGSMMSTETRMATCETHGEYESRNFFGNIWSKCPECAREAAERKKSEEEERARQERLRAWQRKIGQSGIPVRFHNRTLESFKATTEKQRLALEFAKSYAYGFDEVMQTGRSALFVGRPGTGKTHLACGIGLHVMREHNGTVLFTTVMRAIRRVKDSWSRDSHETESQAIETLVEPDLLIIDEVGVQFGSEFERNILFDVLNERYENCLPTILISNLPVNDVAAFLGERVIDRIREDGGKRIVFDWGSHRGKAEL